MDLSNTSSVQKSVYSSKVFYANTSIRISNKWLPLYLCILPCAFFEITGMDLCFLWNTRLYCYLANKEQLSEWVQFTKIKNKNILFYCEAFTTSLLFTVLHYNIAPCLEWTRRLYIRVMNMDYWDQQAFNSNCAFTA